MLIPGKPGRCRIESAKWNITYFDHTEGCEMTVPGTRAATDALMAQLVRTSARADPGLLPPEAAKPRLTLTERLDRWHRFVRHGGASEDGARRQRQHARAVCNGIKVTRVSEITPSAVLEWIEQQRATGGRQGTGISAGTVTVHKPAKTRSRSGDVLPLPPDVVEVLRPLLAAVGKSTVWPNRGAQSQAWWLLGAWLVRAVLAAAGIGARDGEGRVRFPLALGPVRRTSIARG